MAPINMDMSLDWKAQNVVKKDGVWTVDGRPPVAIDLNWHETPSNIPGKVYIGAKVSQPVNSASPPHKHGGAAVAATVISGHTLNQMVCADGTVVGPKIYGPGESWYEGPGCHHVRSENAGDEECVFIASFVIGQDIIEERGLVGALVQYDADEAESVKAKA